MDKQGFLLLVLCSPLEKEASLSPACCLCFVSLQKAVAKKGGKKPLSGFMLFSKEHRPKVKEADPEITFGGIGKRLGELWRALDDKEKEEYKSRKG
jgi:hypothetical protein